MHPPSERGAAGSTSSDLARKVGRVAISVGLRRLLFTVLSALATALVARRLGAGPFGAYASALATGQLAIAFGDLGFSLVLGRDLAGDPAGRGVLLRSVVEVQLVWTLGLTAVVAVLAVLSGLDTSRGQTLLVVAPAVAASALAATRQLYAAMFRVGFVAAVDVCLNVLQIAGTITLALLRAPPATIAAAFTVSTVANSVIVALAAFRLAPARRPQLRERLEVVRRAVPLGVASVLSSAYFTIDLVLLPWLISGPSIGEYGAATKMLSFLVAIPGLVVGAALPGLSLTMTDRKEFSELMARVQHWLATVALPLCGAIVVFAHPLVILLFGRAFAPAAPLFRILGAAAAVAALDNVLGTAMVTLSLIRAQLAGNSCALVLNVVGNVVLVPRYGVEAAAWLTLGTEVFVGVWAWIALRTSIDTAPIARRLVAPMIATAALVALGLSLLWILPVAIPVAALGFVVVLTLMRGWPEEFRAGRPARLLARRDDSGMARA